MDPNLAQLLPNKRVKVNHIVPMDTDPLFIQYYPVPMDIDIPLDLMDVDSFPQPTLVRCDFHI